MRTFTVIDDATGDGCEFRALDLGAAMLAADTWMREREWPEGQVEVGYQLVDDRGVHYHCRARVAT